MLWMAQFASSMLHNVLKCGRLAWKFFKTKFVTLVGCLVLDQDKSICREIPIQR